MKTIATDLEDNGVDPSDLSDTVASVVSELYGTPVTAGEVIKAILRRHPEYASGRANGIEFVEAGKSADVTAWLGRIRTGFPRKLIPQLDARTVLVGLAVSDVMVEEQLQGLGLMPGLQRMLLGLLPQQPHVPQAVAKTQDTKSVSTTEAKAPKQQTEDIANSESTTHAKSSEAPQPVNEVSHQPFNEISQHAPDTASSTPDPPAPVPPTESHPSGGLSSTGALLADASSEGATTPGGVPTATPPQLTFADVLKDFGPRLHPSTIYVFRYAARLGRTLKRVVDSTILLASILYLAANYKKDTGMFFCKLLRDEMTPPPNKRPLSAAMARLILEPDFTTIPFPERPAQTSREYRKAVINNDCKWMIQVAASLSASSNKEGLIYPKHLIGAALYPWATLAVNHRLTELRFDPETLLRRLMDFISEQHNDSEDAKAWQRLFGDTASEENVVVDDEQDKDKPVPPPESEEETASVLHASVSDQAASQDTLGFEPYVTAMADFLTNEHTRPPLTLSIEGEWGSGKSSFMLQLKRELHSIACCKRLELATPHMAEVLKRRDMIPRPLRRFRILRRWMMPSPPREEVSKIMCPTVSFNAWRHDKEDALWASFALEFIRQLKRELAWPARVRAHLRLLALRFKWSEGWVVGLRMVLLTSVLIFLTGTVIYMLFSGGLETVLGRKDEVAKPSWPHMENTGAPPLVQTAPTMNTLWKAPTPTPPGAAPTPTTRTDKLDADEVFLRLIKGTGFIGYLALTIFLIFKFRDYLGNPLSINLRQYIDAPDYDSRVGFIEHFHEDFKKIVETYAGDNKVYVFIDDLDRCDVPKAADLMQALNLMIADSPQLVFIIGMDREKVAAGLAVKYEKMLPYLTPAQPSNAFKRKSQAADGARKQTDAQEVKLSFDPSGGLEYGYSFIEKFIQLPFRVPQPGETDVRRLLDAISPSFASEEEESAPAPHDVEDATSRVLIVDDAAHEKAVEATAEAKSQAEEATDKAAIDKTADEEQAVEETSDKEATGKEAAGEEAEGPANIPATVPAPTGAGTTASASGASVMPTLVIGAGAVQFTEQTLTPAQKESRRKFKLDAFKDSPEIREIILSVAPMLDNNPRRLKQFINMFRLNACIAAETRLNEQLTLEQLGKFVAIGLRWPRLIAYMEDDPALLPELHDWSLKPDSNEASQKEIVNYWRLRPELLRLLSYPNNNGGAGTPDASKFSLRDVSICDLLRVSARVAMTKQPAPTSVNGRPPTD
jgi:hypothetical protein